MLLSLGNRHSNLYKQKPLRDLKRGVFMFRKPTLFEKMLLVIGVVIVLLGYALIQKMASVDGTLLTWNLVFAIFLWLITVLVIILLSVGENVKEEMKIVIDNQTKETRLLRQELRSHKGR